MSNGICADVFERDYANVHIPKMATEIQQILKGIAKAAGVKQTALGAIVGVTQPTISRYFTVDAQPLKPTLDKILAAADRYGVPHSYGANADVSSEDIAAAIERPARRMLQVKGYVEAGGNTRYYALNPGDAYDEIEATDRDGVNSAAVEIKGSSLGQFFANGGWYAVYDDARHPFTLDMVGHPCVVGLADGRILIKTIKRVRGGLFNLHSNVSDDKEPPIENVQIEWAALVTDIRKR